MLGSLDPEQRAVALAARGPVCVLAGAGTGKTRAVAHRIAYTAAIGVVDPARVLAVTFTTRAAGELRGRLCQLSRAVPEAGLERVQARTFHAAALRQLNHFWPGTVGGPAPQVLESKIGLISEAARRLRLSAGLPELRDAAAEVEWAKVTQVRPDDYAEASAKAGRSGPFPPDQLARLFAAYEELRRDRHLVDFESVLELTAAILVEHPDAATAVRDRYQSFVVDEYQDVNPLQKLLLEAWLGDRDDVCVVGDPRQTIYSFTGATPAYLTRLRGRVPRRHGRRAGPQLPVHAAGGGAGQRAEPGPARASRRLGGAPLAAQRAGRPAAACSPSTRTTRPRRPPWPAGIATLISAGTPASEIAVLVRTNAQTQGYRAGAGRRRGAVPGPRARSGSSSGPRCARRSPCCGPRRARCPPGDDPAGQVRPVLAGLGLTREPPVGRGTARDRWESLEALAQLADDFFAGAPGRHAWPTWPASWPCAARPARPGHGGGHARLPARRPRAWSGTSVFLPGLAEGTLPIIYAQHRRGHRRGAAAALRRRHPGPRAAVPVLGAGPVARRPRQPEAVTVPARPAGAGMRPGSPVAVQCGAGARVPTARTMGACPAEPG